MKNMLAISTTRHLVGLAMPLVVICGIIPSICTAQTTSRTWSTHNCDACQSTIFDPGWYTDGTGLFTEAMQIDDGYVTVAASVSGKNIVLALGFGAVEGKSLTIKPSEDVTIQTDSSANMLLMATSGPADRMPKSDITIKKLFKKDAQFTVTSANISAGYLFFPNDPDASNLTVIISYANATFRFPFRRNPTFMAKFGAPDSTPIAIVPAKGEEQKLPTASSGPSVLPANTIPPIKQITSLTPSNQSQGTNAPKSTGVCDKTISFASIQGGQLASTGPSFTTKWVEKNQKKYPSLCFVQSPRPDKTNVLFVFSTSESSFNGLYPTTRASTSTDTSPVYGNGTVTSNYGSTWNYTYSGTVTTTTTTTSQVDLPYTDTSHYLYIYVYDSNGTLLSRHSRSVTTREGGDGANTLGYNLGAALSAIHLKEGLLKEAVASVMK